MKNNTIAPAVLKNKLKYSAPVSLSKEEPKQLICYCEVANTPLTPGGDSPEYRAVVWFPDYTLTTEEEEFLGLTRYLSCSRNHCQQYLLKNDVNPSDDFAKVVYETLLWFEEHSADSNPLLARDRGNSIMDTL